jgi:hypothetical protein
MHGTTMADDGSSALFQVFEATGFVGREWDDFLGWVRAPRAEFPFRIRCVIGTVLQVGLRALDSYHPSEGVRAELDRLRVALDPIARIRASADETFVRAANVDGDGDEAHAPFEARPFVSVFEASAFFGWELKEFLSWLNDPLTNVPDRIAYVVGTVLRVGLREFCRDHPSDEVRADLDRLLGLLVGPPDVELPFFDTKGQRAKKAFACRSCRQWISVGDEIRWTFYRGGRTGVHWGCSDP